MEIGFWALFPSGGSRRASDSVLFLACRGFPHSVAHGFLLSSMPASPQWAGGEEGRSRNKATPFPGSGKLSQTTHQKGHLRGGLHPCCPCHCGHPCAQLCPRALLGILRREPRIAWNVGAGRNPGGGDTVLT